MIARPRRHGPATRTTRVPLVTRPTSSRRSSTATAQNPREPAAWRRTRLREAVGATCWAYPVGDSDFEAQGHRMIADHLPGR